MSAPIDDLIGSNDFLGDLGRRYAREFMTETEALPPKPDDLSAMVWERTYTFRQVLLLAGTEPDVALAGSFTMHRALVDEAARLLSAIAFEAGRA